MQYRGCEAKSSKDFYAAFRTYIGLVEYSPAHAHAEVEMCTYKYKKNTDTKTCTHATHFMFSMIFTMTGLYALDFLWTEKQIETSVHELMTSIILLVTIQSCDHSNTQYLPTGTEVSANVLGEQMFNFKFARHLM